MNLYQSQIACKIADISARKLDYWVTTGLISPDSVYQGPNEHRVFFLFSFANLVQLRIISALRRTGVSLQRIRDALDVVREESGEDWHSLWLVSNGQDVQVVRQAEIVETLTGHRKGQLAFAMVAIGTASTEVKGSLLKMDSPQFERERFDGKVSRYNRAS